MNQVVVYHSVSNKGENLTSTSHQKLKTANKNRLKKTTKKTIYCIC